MKPENRLYLSDDVRKQNRLRILRQFRSVGRLSRTDLGKQTELSPGTVTNVTTGLLSDQIIRVADENVGEGRSQQGRPRVQLDLNPDFACVATCVFNFNGLQINVLDYAGDNIASVDHQFEIEKLDADSLAEKIHELVSGLGLKKKLDQYVIGVQGLTSNDGRDLLWSPIVNLGDKSFSDILSGLSSAKVTLANDCAMIAKSLAKSRGLETSSFVTLLMSYGIGMSLNMEGSSFQGIKSSASELGHVTYQQNSKALCRCGKRGCIEAYASDYAIWRTANEKPDDYLPEFAIKASDIEEIIERAKAKDGPERKALREAGRALGFGLSTMFGFFDPCEVIFVGKGAQALDFMEDDIRNAMKEHFRFQEEIDVAFDIDLEAQQHIENGCAIVALDLMDQKAALETSADG